LPPMLRLPVSKNLPYDYSRQMLVARILVLVAGPASLIFFLIHLPSGHWLEASGNAFLALIAVAIWIAASKPGADPARSYKRLKLLLLVFIVYLICLETCIFLFAKRYSGLLWLYPMPLILFFALGRRIAIVSMALFLAALIVLLGGSLAQTQKITILPADVWRFIAVFFIMGIMGFFMERELGRDRQELLEKQSALLRSESLYREACVKLVDQINRRNQIEHTTQGLIEQVRQGQKMEAMAQLAVGASHDFNNLLGAMMGFTRMAENELPAGHPQKEKLSLALKAGEQAKNLLRRLMDFSRHEDSDRQPLYLGGLLREALALVRPLLSPAVGLQTDLPETVQDDFAVNANSGQIQQVLFNLCQNASQAMAQAGGTIAVKLCKVELAPDEALKLDFKPGAYAKLMVGDTGPGLSPQTLEMVFEPFFTTKRKGHGTGMGLFVSRAIVEAHGGRIIAHSNQSHGAQFTIYLPLCRVRSVEQILPKTDDLLRGSGQRILYVDDVESLTMSISLVLRELGYRVDTCASAEAALEILGLKWREIDLVICDQNMEGMCGVDLVRECRRLYPELPVIISTGNSGLIDSDELRSLGVENVLAKPVSVRRLSHAVHQTLHHPREDHIVISNGWGGRAV